MITIEPSTGDLAGFYKLRIGDYRVLYEILHEEGTPEYREVLTRMMRECMKHAGDKLRDTARILAILDDNK